MVGSDWLRLGYLISAVLFIYGLKGLTSPKTAVRGNLISAAGMLLAILVTLVDRSIVSYGAILAGLVVGSAIGAFMAYRIQMTAMPQMVALMNGFGGLASSLVGGAATLFAANATSSVAIATAATGLIGAVTFTGSVLAFAKLQELMTGSAILLPARHLMNASLAALTLAACIWVVMVPTSTFAFVVLSILAMGLGIMLVLPIGGADMPVVIALLNAFSGLAAAATGFVIGNPVLIVSGALVGSSGIILTRLMCKAMNRSLTNVIFGVMATGESSSTSGDKKSLYDGRVKSTNADEIAMLLDAGRRVVIVPGFGLAVAQAQHAVRDLTDLLIKNGKEVEFGIHPVAGRMPGHMNVLLAEAEIPYDLLLEMDRINPSFNHTDVVLVVGANDVVNPLARTDPTGPIGGMPILNVDEARTVIVLKRSLSPGYAGIDNPLFAADNTLMFFADAKKGLNDIVVAYNEI